MIDLIKPRVALAVALFCTAAHAAPQVPTAKFFADPQYRSVRISPDGKYLAVVMPDGAGRELVAFIDLKDRKVSGSARFTGSNTVVSDFRWTSNDRVLIESATKFFGLDAPRRTGDLYGVDADGGNFKALVGPDIRNETLQSVSSSKRDAVAFYGLLHPLPGDPRSAIVWSRPPTGADWSVRWSYPVAMRLDVRSGRTSTILKGPVQGGMLYTDKAGDVRFADGLDETRTVRKLVYRDATGGDWRDLGDVLEKLGEDSEILGVGGADGRSIYAIGENEESRDVFRISAEGGAPERIAGRSGHDVTGVEWDAERTRVVAVEYMPGRFERQYLEPAEPHAKLLRTLESSFPGHQVEITSTSSDRKLAVVFVASDVNSGDYYLYDAATRKVEYLFSRHPDLDPEQMAAKEPIEVTARDGLKLHGYLSRPPGRTGKLPMVVLVHGGPHGPRDDWNFEPDVQFLANRGYAVLQVNFRGSGGYGPRFEAAGYRRWGAEMQDDVTDATRWAIAQGIADPERICIAGASYGGYAALMGVGKEPDLYKCAFGYVGVYDLPLMFGQGDIPESSWGVNYLRKALGTDQADLAARSPITHVARIKAALMLAHGGRDERAHPEHYHRLKRALEKAGKSYEDVWKPNEGHGFLQTENKVELYDKLAAFLAKHIGT